MSTAGTETAGLTLSLTEEERSQLLPMLEQALRETLVEAHRTESTDFRKYVEQREAALRSVIGKLRRP